MQERQNHGSVRLNLIDQTIGLDDQFAHGLVIELSYHASPAWKLSQRPGSRSRLIH
jgi:hypothetical protein